MLDYNKREMNVVWLSNIPIPNTPMASSGTWIYAMAMGLESTEKVNITCISCQRLKNKVSYRVNDRLRQIVFPFNDRFTIEPTKSLIESILLEIDSIAPDIIHVWGTEMFWGNLPFDRLRTHAPVLLDMQGYMQSVYDNCLGDLSLGEQVRCIGWREILLPRSSFYHLRRLCRKQGEREEDIIKNVDYVSAQSKWIESVLRIKFGLNDILSTKIMLRPSFYNSSKWELKEGCNTIFTTASPTQPLKGLLSLLKSFTLVSIRCPQAKLRIAGMNPKGMLSPGYTKLIKSFVDKNHLKDKVEFCGLLNTDELIKEFLECRVYVNPSFVESYSLALAEAMMLGVPSVASYVGAMPELGTDEMAVNYYPKGDYVACAGKILTLLSDEQLSKRNSISAIEVSMKKHNPEEVIKRQIDIYNFIMKQSQK